MAADFGGPFESIGVILQFKVAADLVAQIRKDLERPHEFAHERVGFITANAANLPHGGLLVLANGYFPVADDHYIDEPRVGALMGPDALRLAMQHAYHAKCSILHVHMHGHEGWPWFSRYDLSENAKFVPDFFNVSAAGPHGAIVLSIDSASGIVWRQKVLPPAVFDEVIEVGAPLRIHRRQP